MVTIDYLLNQLIITAPSTQWWILSLHSKNQHYGYCQYYTTLVPAYPYWCTKPEYTQVVGNKTFDLSSYPSDNYIAEVRDFESNNILASTTFTIGIIPSIPVVSNVSASITSDNRLNLSWHQDKAGNFKVTVTDSSGFAQTVLQGAGILGNNTGQTGILTILTVGTHNVCVEGY